MDIISEYASGKSINDLVKATGLSQYKIRKVLLGAGVLRSREDGHRLAVDGGKLGKAMLGKKREFSDEWKRNISIAKKAAMAGKSKGVSLKPNGYIEYTTGEYKGRSVHVVEVEKRIGRRLFANEVVHHKDGDRSNNSIDNLDLMTRAEHAAHHARENCNKRERDDHGKFK